MCLYCNLYWPTDCLWLADCNELGRRVGVERICHKFVIAFLANGFCIIHCFHCHWIDISVNSFEWGVCDYKDQLCATMYTFIWSMSTSDRIWISCWSKLTNYIPFPHSSTTRSSTLHCSLSSSWIWISCWCSDRNICRHFTTLHCDSTGVGSLE